MKQSTLSVLVGFLLVIIFGLLLFAYQVRQTEVAVVTTFGKPISNPVFVARKLSGSG